MTNLKLKSIALAMLLMFLPIKGQDVVEVSHEKLYFQTIETIFLKLGPPRGQKALSDSMFALIYPIENRAEIMWVVFGYFNKWYPDYGSWSSIFPTKVPVVVNISYYPVLPGGGDEVLH